MTVLYSDFERSPYDFRSSTQVPAFIVLIASTSTSINEQGTRRSGWFPPNVYHGDVRCFAEKVIAVTVVSLV